ncbi:MAG: hypothetical protein U0R24_04810 [Solirubrobacterales bacterium]
MPRLPPSDSIGDGPGQQLEGNALFIYGSGLGPPPGVHRHGGRGDGAVAPGHLVSQ